MVHRREVDGQEIVLGNHGALWGNAMTWWDHDTGSVWSQPIGAAILGPRAGATLELLPSALTTWADWQLDHPETLALDAEDLFTGFALDQMAVVVEFGDESIAYPVVDVRAQQVVNSDVGGVPIAVVVLEGSDRWAVLSRTLDDGEVIELEVDEGDLFEVGGDRSWDPIRGLARSGTDQDLNVLPGFTSFPRDYVTFFGDGFFWQPDGLVPIS